MAKTPDEKKAAAKRRRDVKKFIKKLAADFDLCPFCGSDDLSPGDYDGGRDLSCTVECGGVPRDVGRNLSVRSGHGLQASGEARVSTKIYTGWRCPVAKLNDVLIAMRDHAYAAAADRVRKYAATIVSGVALDHEVKALTKTGGFAAGIVRRVAQVRLAFDEAVASSSRQDRVGLMDIDASANVWLHRGRAYLIPYGELWGWTYVPAGAENYQYRNNTDRPDDVTDRAWQARRRTWDAVCLDDWDTTRLTHVVIAAKNDGFGLTAVCRLVLKSQDPFKVLR